MQYNTPADTYKIPTIFSCWVRIYPWFALIAGLSLAFCQWLIFAYAPLEITMGLPQKIFYLHLPLAWWGLFSFFIVFITSIFYLITRSIFWDELAHAAAQTGLSLATLALVSGAIWGKFAWGVWWTWDARLTTTLIMCFIYAGYLLLRKTEMNEVKRSKSAAVVGIAAFLDVPLVYFSARLWSYVHPPSIALDPPMKLVVIACIAAFGFLWVALVSVSCHQGILERRANYIAQKRLINLR